MADTPKIDEPDVHTLLEQVRKQILQKERAWSAMDERDLAAQRAKIALNAVDAAISA